MTRELKEVLDMSNKGRDVIGDNSIYRHRPKCAKPGCLTHWVMCKPWMCPDYTRKGA